MDSILLGLVAIVVGALIAAYGARAFFLLLPLFGFVLGFHVGGQAIGAILGDGLFATLLGWGAGLVTGLVFAILAGLSWWAAIVILFGVVGYQVGYGVLVALGFHDPGFLPFVAGVALGVALAILAIVLDAPTLLVAAVTAFGGAAYVVAGAYLLLNQITVAQLQDGPIGALGVPLLAERTIAVDPRSVPLGAPVFLSTTRPNSAQPLNRLVMAQDTGGAIKGAVRADFFWGFGKAAGELAGRMKQSGTMWVLLPPEAAPK